MPIWNYPVSVALADAADVAVQLVYLDSIRVLAVVAAAEPVVVLEVS